MSFERSAEFVFWWLDLPAAWFWARDGTLSLTPLLGSALVWRPAARLCCSMGNGGVRRHSALGSAGGGPVRQRALPRRRRTVPMTSHGPDADVPDRGGAPLPSTPQAPSSGRWCSPPHSHWWRRGGIVPRTPPLKSTPSLCLTSRRARLPRRTLSGHSCRPRSVDFGPIAKPAEGRVQPLKPMSAFVVKSMAAFGRHEWQQGVAFCLQRPRTSTILD